MGLVGFDETLQVWVSREWAVAAALSTFEIRMGDSSEYLDMGLGLSYNRARWSGYEPRLADLFPGIDMSPGYLVLPIWFILCAFLSALLLLWLVLMKRLARPRIAEE